MSTAIGTLLELFLKPQKEAPRSCGRMIGIILLLIGGGLGTFYLFEALVPIIGYVESGASISILLLAVGGILLFINRQKEVPSSSLSLLSLPSLSSFPPVQDILKDLNVEKEIKNNAGKIVLAAFGAGMALSQLTNLKKLSEVYKLIK